MSQTRLLSRAINGLCDYASRGFEVPKAWIVQAFTRIVSWVGKQKVERIKQLYITRLLTLVAYFVRNPRRLFKYMRGDTETVAEVNKILPRRFKTVVQNTLSQLWGFIRKSKKERVSDERRNTESTQEDTRINEASTKPQEPRNRLRHADANANLVKWFNGDIAAQCLSEERVEEVADSVDKEEIEWYTWDKDLNKKVKLDKYEVAILNEVLTNECVEYIPHPGDKSIVKRYKKLNAVACFVKLFTDDNEMSRVIGNDLTKKLKTFMGVESRTRNNSMRRRN